MTVDETTKEPALETDERFPSGAWTGFFLMPILPGRHWMELDLSFRNGTISGTGRDRIGAFLITGRYDTVDGKCWWTKRYIGMHDVSYSGYNEGRGIWGTWKITLSTGGFHIWPEGMNVGEGLTRAAEVDAPNDPAPTTNFNDLGAESLEPVGVGVGSPSESDADAEPKWN